MIICGAQAQSSATEQSGEFRKGDVVRIRPEKANSYIQPIRKWGKEGRLATVIWHRDSDSVIVLFHTKRPPKRESDYREIIDPEDLELVERPAEQSGSTVIIGSEGSV